MGAIVAVSRLIMAAIVLAAADPFGAAGKWALSPLEDHSRRHGHALELIVVMVITPFIFNTFQLWVQDTFLKFSKSWRTWRTCCHQICDEDTQPATQLTPTGSKDRKVVTALAEQPSAASFTSPPHPPPAVRRCKGPDSLRSPIACGVDSPDGSFFFTCNGRFA
eukprot:NODE_1508_length_587_cov_514.345725_g1208_i0.p2 GENE.NODE_1508_length_587_cov_514.345725_g1208_i0~~NODE_1508_length_587_cov_514.345725_g1208_i0.p2  ORF type:complete len:173 (-),score=37.66 NODE_1508_length_587_cov_514.345725_g1208_i0:67-558(-)